MLICVHHFVKFCHFDLKILSGNKILASIKGCNSVTILGKMMPNDANLDLVNVNVDTTFGQIMSICSQENEQK